MCRSSEDYAEIYDRILEGNGGDEEATENDINEIFSDEEE